MRTWSLEDRGDHVCIRLPDTGIVCCIEDVSAVDHYFPTLLALGQFIVDACNAAEAQQEREKEPWDSYKKEPCTCGPLGRLVPSSKCKRHGYLAQMPRR